MQEDATVFREQQFTNNALRHRLAVAIQSAKRKVAHSEWQCGPFIKVCRRGLYLCCWGVRRGGR